MELFAGIDIGSRSIELAVVDARGELLEWVEADTGFDPLTQASELLKEVAYTHIMATGYGRTLMEIAIDAQTVTEIKAHARGARAWFPQAETVLDMGGQDCKAIALFPSGKVKKFEMNDRCAAGTGKFMEIMAKALGYTLEEFSSASLQGESQINISSMCTVFAESEVTSLIGRGEDRQAIARGLHQSVVRRVRSMLARVSDHGDIVFTGGVANSACMRALLQAELGRPILVPPNPQITGAHGAALLAMEQATQP